MIKLTIAAAQSLSFRGDIHQNLEKHYSLIEAAASNDVDLLVFPELSSTGYEPDLAEKLAFSPEDERLNLLREKSVRHKMIIIVGAPVRIKSNLHIGAFIFFPDRSISIYTKRYLHPGEEEFFKPGKLNPNFKLGNEVVSLAICADTSNPRHPKDAAKKGTTIYLASVLFPENGFEVDVRELKSYAQQYKMLVLMANHGGESGGFFTAGRSSIWSNKGELLAEFLRLGEGLVIASRENEHWTGSTITIY